MNTSEPTLEIFYDPATIQRILAERTHALAREPLGETATTVIQTVVVRLAQERYGLPIRQVRAVRPLGTLTPVPGAPAHWAGLVNVRGRLYAVLNLLRYWGLATDVWQATAQLVLVSANSLEVGLVVDEVTGIQAVRQTELRPLLPDESRIKREWVLGTTTALLTVLDVEALLADASLVVQEEVV